MTISEPTRRMVAVTPAAVDESHLLPGEVEVDDALLDDAVLQINTIQHAKSLETARLIGELVLARFFGGDLGAFHARGRRHLTFKELSRRPDLQVSYSTLWHSVAVVEQLRLLPPDVAEALPLSHHRLLIPVRDPEIKLAIAREAIESGVTKTELAARVQAVRGQSANPRGSGRRALPPWVKAVGRLTRDADLAPPEIIDAKTLQQLGPERAAALLESLDERVQNMLDLRAKLEAALAANLLEAEPEPEDATDPEPMPEQP